MGEGTGVRGRAGERSTVHRESEGFGISRPLPLVLPGGSSGFPGQNSIPYACEAMKMTIFPRSSRRPALMAAVLASLLLSCGGATAGNAPAPGRKADFQLKTVDGRHLGPKDFPGQVVV